MSRPVQPADFADVIGGLMILAFIVVVPIAILLKATA